MADCYEVLRAQGYTDGSVGVLWEGKIPQEILAGAGGNGTMPQVE